MTPTEFKRKWHRYQGKESSAYHEHFNDLCAGCSASPLPPKPTRLPDRAFKGDL